MVMVNTTTYLKKKKCTVKAIVSPVIQNLPEKLIERGVAEVRVVNDAFAIS